MPADRDWYSVRAAVCHRDVPMSELVCLPDLTQLLSVTPGERSGPRRGRLAVRLEELGDDTRCQRRATGAIR